ncbi:hypothetical protein LTS03_012078, partial [Exophiala xenobiotica]
KTRKPNTALLFHWRRISTTSEEVAARTASSLPATASLTPAPKSRWRRRRSLRPTHRSMPATSPAR